MRNILYKWLKEYWMNALVVVFVAVGGVFIGMAESEFNTVFNFGLAFFVAAIVIASINAKKEWDERKEDRLQATEHEKREIERHREWLSEQTHPQILYPGRNEPTVNTNNNQKKD